MTVVCLACWTDLGEPEPLLSPVIVAACEKCGRAERPCYQFAPRLYDRCPRHRCQLDVDNRCWDCFAERQAVGELVGVFRIDCPA